MDKEYWDNYYAHHKSPDTPTTFAHFTLEHLPQDATVLELGCGNGRDSKFFAQNAFDILACDQCVNIIDSLKQANEHNIKYFVADLSNMNGAPVEPFNVAYARFVLHALDEDECTNMLKWVFRNLPSGGLFLSETRTTMDDTDVYGEEVADHIYFTDHCRRIVRAKDLLEDFEDAGFHVQYALNSQGLAVYKDDDPMILRLVAQKP